MAFKKYTQSEGKLEVLRGLEAEVLNQHFAKTGKRAVSDFSDEEREALASDLDVARDEESRASEQDSE